MLQYIHVISFNGTFRLPRKGLPNISARMHGRGALTETWPTQRHQPSFVTKHQQIQGVEKWTKYHRNSKQKLYYQGNKAGNKKRGHYLKSNLPSALSQLPNWGWDLKIQVLRHSSAYLLCVLAIWQNDRWSHSVIWGHTGPCLPGFKIPSLCHTGRNDTNVTIVTVGAKVVAQVVTIPGQQATLQKSSCWLCFWNMKSTSCIESS